MLRQYEYHGSLDFGVVGSGVVAGAAAPPMTVSRTLMLMSCMPAPPARFVPRAIDGTRWIRATREGSASCRDETVGRQCRSTVELPSQAFVITTAQRGCSCATHST